MYLVSKSRLINVHLQFMCIYSIIIIDMAMASTCTCTVMKVMNHAVVQDVYTLYTMYMYMVVLITNHFFKWPVIETMYMYTVLKMCGV